MGEDNQSLNADTNNVESPSEAGQGLSGMADQRTAQEQPGLENKSDDNQETQEQTQDKGGTENESKEDTPPTRAEINRFYAQKRQLNKQAKSSSQEDNPPTKELTDDQQPDINQMLDEKLAPVVQEYQKQKDEAEINKALAQYPMLKDYADKARKYWQHESRKNLPFISVLFEVAGPDTFKIGAQQAQEANQQAAQFQPTGSSTRGVSPKKGAWQMSNEEFQAEILKAKMNRPR